MNTQNIYQYSYTGSISHDEIVNIHQEMFPSVRFNISYCWRPASSGYLYNGPISYEDMDRIHEDKSMKEAVQMYVNFFSQFIASAYISPLESVANQVQSEDQSNEENSVDENSTPNPYHSTLSEIGDASVITEPSTGHGPEILPNTVGAGSEVSTSEPLKRRQLLEETMKSKFISMSESYHGSQTVFVKNKKVYYRGKGLYAIRAKNLPREFISAIEEMSQFEEDWTRYHGEMMAIFQTLQEEFGGQYPSLNVLTYKWFNDPACETFDYINDHAAVKARFEEHFEIRSRFGSLSGKG